MRDRFTPRASSATMRSHAALAATVGATALGWGLTAAQLHRERTDEQTGLPNRRRFMATVKRHLRRHRGDLRLVLLDLNWFKTVNDTYGHAAGNVVLRHTGQRLTEALSTRLVAATRLHGDEFAALIKQPRREDLDLIRRALSSPVELSPWVSVPTSASVGGVLIPSRSGATASSALHAADQQMYLSKGTDSRRPRRSRPEPSGSPLPMCSATSAPR